MRAGVVWLAVVACGGCWSSDPLVDGAFTPPQWAALQKEFRLPVPPDPCAIAGLRRPACDAALGLAKQLFSDRSLSGNGAVSCETCHDAPRAWIDVRVPANISASSASATGWTKRNAMTLLNLGYKPRGQHVFTWSGEYTTAGQVLDLAVVKAMGSNVANVAAVVRNSSAYSAAYTTAFEGPPPADDAMLFLQLEQAFDGYLSEFATGASPFDHYLDGEPTALSDSQKRGFAVFVGRGGCSECHSGPLLSDLQLHNTGVPQASTQAGPPVPTRDPGRADITTAPADNGKFLTGSLREIASTGPYMHDGRYDSLVEVIGFYRGGGGGGDFPENHDPRVQPLEISDDEAQDLEAFLGALSECDATTCPDHHAPHDAGVVADAPGPVADAPSPWSDGALPDAPSCLPPLQTCGTPPMCRAVQTDSNNCGTCGHVCFSYQMCLAGTCM